MKLRTKIFSILALIAAAFYGLEIVLNLLNGKTALPVMVKILLVVLFLSYGVRNLHQWITATSQCSSHSTHS